MNVPDLSLWSVAAQRTVTTGAEGGGSSKSHEPIAYTWQTRSGTTLHRFNIELSQSRKASREKWHGYWSAGSGPAIKITGSCQSAEGVLAKIRESM